MATVSRAKAKENGEPLPHYERPADWLPHFIRVDVETGRWRKDREKEDPKNSDK
mgnify:CR=1 FL=1|jgi:hypothetical protein|tara:strand:+ start:269 stop:430 length:162 start_codon:yes stop_codon:yes gene_type:complete